MFDVNKNLNQELLRLEKEIHPPCQCKFNSEGIVEIEELKQELKKYEERLRIIEKLEIDNNLYTLR